MSQATKSLAASQSEFAAALLQADHPLPAGITTARGKPDPARFAVYRNNVFVSLTRALAQRFPVTGRLVGTDFFTAMARAYAQDHKPASPMIFDYGDDFPAFIAGFGPAHGLPYLPDVARIEVAWTRAYHARDCAALGLADLAGIAPDHLADLRFMPHPAAALVVSPWPAGSIWAAHQQQEVAPPGHRRAEAVLILRPALTVQVHILPAGDLAFAEALLVGQPVGTAAETAAAANKAFDAGAALVGLITLGAFCAPPHAEGDRP